MNQDISNRLRTEFPELQTAASVAAYFSEKNASDTSVKAFWAKAIATYLNIKGDISFKIGDIKDAFTIDRTIPVSLLIYIRSELGNKVWASDQMGNRPQSSEPPSSSSIISNVVKGSVSAGIWALSSAWWLMTGNSVFNADRENCDDGQDCLDTSDLDTVDLILPSMFQDLSAIIISHAESENKTHFALIDKVLDRTFHRFVKIALSSKCSKNVSDSVVSLLIDYMHVKGHFILSKDQSVLRILTPFSANLRADIAEIPDDDVEMTKFKLMLQIEQLEVQLQDKESIIAKCEADARSFETQGKRNEAIRELRRRREVQKSVDTLRRFIIHLESQNEALNNAQTNLDMLAATKQTNNAFKILNNDPLLKKADEIVEEFEEELEKSKAISQSVDDLSKSLNDLNIDEEELLRELEELANPSILQAGGSTSSLDFPSVPITVTSSSMNQNESMSDTTDEVVANA